MKLKLSILIPSLACRPKFLADLLACLEPQLEKNGRGIEILISIDNADKQVGIKRNELVERATGEYIVFIDDDDLLAPDYIEKVMKALETGVDYVGYQQVLFMIERNTRSLVKSMAGAKWETKDGVYIRGVQHICPVKRELAVQVKFPETSFGEDREWGVQMEKLVKTFISIEEPLYFYNYRRLKTNETTNGHKE